LIFRKAGKLTVRPSVADLQRCPAFRFITHIGGALIHLILVVALVVFVVNLLTGRRTI
jgi:hypothetical protein